jgi:predicted amidohydrolase
MTEGHLRAALIQTSSSDDPASNRVMLTEMVREAAAGGAQLAVTPEVSNLISLDKAHQRASVSTQEADETLAAMRALAADLGIWLLLGSLSLDSGDPDGRLANRSLLIGPDGALPARYDKIHMFDVDVSATETWRESATFRPGERAVLHPTPWGGLGLTICYDLRFPALYRALAQAGASIITVPAAFTVPTGEAHWHVLLRARAIETGCFILAPAQTGLHPAREGAKRRATYGHSLAVAPWGEVIVDAGEAPGVSFVDLDLSAVAEARKRVPSLRHDRDFAPPNTL